MAKNLDLQKEKLERERERVKIKERLLKEKERQRKAKRFTDVGRIASKANIDSIDDEILFGAFLEISEKIRDDDVVVNWKEKAKAFEEKKKIDDQEALCVVFNSAPSSDIKKFLRSKNFKWNGFRKEFYGYGISEKLISELSGADCKVEIVN